MRCLECDTETERLDGAHLRECCGLTLQEYALRHGLALDALLAPGQRDLPDDPAAYPPPPDPQDREARLTLAALAGAGRLAREDGFELVPGEIRLLDQLLWLETRLVPLGFRFRQEYRGGSHGRATALNRLKRPRPERAPPALGFAALDEAERARYAALVLTGCAVRRGAYLFLHPAAGPEGEALAAWLRDACGIELAELEPPDDRVWLRVATPADAARLLARLLPQLREIPQALERLEAGGPEAAVVKEQGLDAAHFITDHPGACANLHGGHYAVRVRLRDRIDPGTGFVMDYGDLKRILRARVIDALDHRALNYAAPELAWRSSTELLAAWIWERLIEYLPTLDGLEIHETRTSCCQYRGPSLEAFLRDGRSPALGHFQRPELGRDRPMAGARRLRLVRG